MEFFTNKLQYLFLIRRNIVNNIFFNKFVILCGTLMLQCIIINVVNASIDDNSSRYDPVKIGEWNTVSSNWVNLGQKNESSIFYLERIQIDTNTIKMCGHEIDISGKEVYSLYVNCKNNYIIRDNYVKIELISQNYINTRLELIDIKKRVKILKISSRDEIIDFIPNRIEDHFPEYTLFME